MHENAAKQFSLAFMSWLQNCVQCSTAVHVTDEASWLHGMTCLCIMQALQDKKTLPPQQSFDSWADVSPTPVQAVAVMPNGTIDTA